MIRLKTALCAALLCAVWTGSARDAHTQPKDQAWVEAQVQKIEIRQEERRLDEIGWAHDIRDAERLAKESGRPVFLFTHDGRLNIGRC